VRTDAPAMKRRNEKEEKNPVSYKKLSLMLGVILCSHGLAAAQSFAQGMAMAEAHVAPAAPMVRAASAPLPAAAFFVPQGLGTSPVQFSFPFAGTYVNNYSFEELSPMEEVKTLVLTQSSLPLVQIWGGRFQLDAFQTTLHIQNVQFGPFASGGMRDSRLPRQTYPGGPRSVELSGLSLSFHFGRGERTGHPAQLWRHLKRIVGAVLN
jgi:hypothetical protein